MGIHGIVVDIGRLQDLPFIVLYVGPETILPLTSALAAIVGVVLMVWHRVVAVGRRMWRAITKKSMDEGSRSK